MPPGVAVVPSVDEAGEAETVLLALKPQNLEALRRTSFSQRKPRLLLSILAGVEFDTLDELCGAQNVIRAMPNLPVSIGQGVVALHAHRSVSAEVRQNATALMGSLGSVEWIADERLFDAVTALAGCGPGFVYRFIGALADAGAALGLDPAVADRLARATVAGAAAMAAGSADPPLILADRVASRGGSTRAGLDVLDRENALGTLVARTLAAAAERNAEMASAARQT